MDRIRELLYSFNKNEKKHLRNYLSSLHTKGQNKALELILMLEKRKSLSQEEASQELYGNPKSKAFIMMKSRLYERMLEILSLSLTISSNEPSWGRHYNIEKLKLNKQLTYASLLYTRKLRSQAMDMFQKCYDSAKELGLPEIAIVALLNLRNHYATYNMDLYDDSVELIEAAFDEYLMDTHAQTVHDKFRSLYGLKAQYDEPIQWLEENLPPLIEELGDNDYPRAKYYIYSLKINYYNFIKDYKNCKYYLNEIIELVQKIPFFNSPIYLPLAYLHLAMLELNFLNTRESLKFADQAHEFLNNGNMNHQVMLLIKTYALMHEGRLEDAKGTLQKLEEFLEKHQYTLNWGMMHFLHATINFIEKDYEKALQSLEHVSDLSFDKEGWITGIKILEILIHIETEELDHAIAKIENLRKHLGRYEVEDRAKLFYKLLAGLEKTGFDYSIPVRKEDFYLEKLEEVNVWIPSGYETIRFHKWFKYKRGLDGTTYKDIYVIGPNEKIKKTPDKSSSI